MVKRLSPHERDMLGDPVLRWLNRGMIAVTMGFGLIILGCAIMAWKAGDTFTAAFLAVGGVIVGLPPDYDPTIRLKKKLLGL